MCGVKMPNSRIEERKRRQRPDRHQDHLALQIVPDLDLFLVLVAGLVHHVVVLGLEKEMTDLPAGHRHQPAGERRQGRIREHHHIGEQEADGAQQMERLIDPAVMIVAMVIPPLHSQSLEKSVHSVPAFRIRQCYVDSMNPM